MKPTSEAAFETAIESVLLADGYTQLDGKGFDRKRAIFPAEVLGLHPGHPAQGLGEA